VALLFQGKVNAMGLRSFVALPVEKGGRVARFLLEHNADDDRKTLFMNGAYGLSGRQTLLLGLPYRLSPSGEDRLGDVSALYRHITWQDDTFTGTRRLGLLGGAVIPTASERDPALQAGFVTTVYRNRWEWDTDVIYRIGLADRPDSAQYDLSFQYRLSPAQYPDWGIGAEWDTVIELNGRWQEGESIVHQVTGGLQWIHRNWVLEGGLVQDLNGPESTRAIVSLRVNVPP
jgi:hypothetical protein